MRRILKTTTLEVTFRHRLYGKEAFLEISRTFKVRLCKAGIVLRWMLI